MVGLNKNNRASLSFSENGDADLLAVLRDVNYNFAGFCKELMRDGLKYRSLPDKFKTQVVNIPPVMQESTIRTGVVKKQVSAVVDKDDLKKHVASKLDKF